MYFGSRGERERESVYNGSERDYEQPVVVDTHIHTREGIGFNELFSGSRGAYVTK